MFSSGHLISGLDVATGTFALMVFSAGAALVGLIVLGRFVFLRAGQSGMAGMLWVCGLALVGSMFAFALFDRSTFREQAAERRAFEARATELTARSLAPSSPLACLDTVASVVVENACEKPLFASPEAVAAAVAYVDARFSLLAAGTMLAQRDASYMPVLERLRRGLEADRFGVVAHVLTTRGCSAAECAELRLLQDPGRVAANMKARTFEALLGVHALAWPAGGAGVALAPPPSAGPGIGQGSPITSGGPGATAGATKFDFPSANSIPPVSIMNAEPSAPPEPEAKTVPPAQPKRPPTPAPRRQATQPAPAAPAPPQRITPPAPEEPTPATPPQTSGSR
jgi:hypothetical protein